MHFLEELLEWPELITWCVSSSSYMELSDPASADALKVPRRICQVSGFFEAVAAGSGSCS